MLSRETSVHVAIVVLAVAVFFAVPQLFYISDPTVSVVVSVLFNALIFGGAHLVLAVLGEGNKDYPVTARWRTVGLVAGLATIALSGYALGELTTLSGQTVEYGAIGAAGVVILVYWYLEARDGYRESKPDQGTI